MKKTITTFILVLLFNLLHAQNPLVKQWDYRFGGTGIEYFYSLQQTRDGGYILGGRSASGISGDKTQANWGLLDYWIVKTDSLGIKQWDRDFGGTGGDLLNSIQQTAEGGYILGGYSNSSIIGDKTQATWGGLDYWIVKTDSLGTKQWDKDFGGTGDDNLWCIQQTTDGGYILGGYSNSCISGDKTQDTIGSYDYWIVKTDSLGIKQWDKDFGGTDDDKLFSIQQTADGGYILAGWSYSGISGDKTEAIWGNVDYWIIKTDSLGIKQWDKDFGGTDYDYFSSIQQTSDGGYIVGGYTYSGISGDKTQANWGGLDYWIVKMDSLGIKQWDKDFGGTSNDEIYKVSQTTDGGYLLSGDSYSPISGDKTESNLGQEQIWVVKTNSLGNKQWDKTIFTSGHDEIGLAIQTIDRCYAIANYSDGGIAGNKTQVSQGSYDYWLIKFCDTTQCNLSSPSITQTGDTLTVLFVYTTYQWYHDSIPISGASSNYYVAPASGNYNVVVTDSNGCSVGAGILNVIASVELTNSSGEFIILPNPTTNTFTIKNISKEKSLVEIINVFGEIVYTENLFGRNEYLIHTNLVKGIYFVRVQDVVRKLVVE